jgi:hypothetical protein
MILTPYITAVVLTMAASPIIAVAFVQFVIDPIAQSINALKGSGK